MADVHGNGHAPHGDGVGHEQTDTGIGLLVWGAVVLVIATAFTLVLVWGIFNWFKHREVEGRVQAPMASPSQIPPEPRLQIKSDDQIIELHNREDHILSSYAWVDEKGGIVRIPIDKAMDLLMKKGLPMRGSAPPRKTAQAAQQEGTQSGTK